MTEPRSTPPPQLGKRPVLPSRFVPLTVLLLVIILLSLFLPGFFQQVIYDPIVTFLILLQRVYRGIPQNIIWGVLVLITTWVMLAALRPARRLEETPGEEKTGATRFSWLVELATDSRSGQHARWELAREMQQIAIQVIQAETGETDVSLRQRIAKGEQLPAPPEINALLRLCADLPNYRSFLEARDGAPNKRIPQLDALDLEGAAAALTQWHHSHQERH
jgi:hypothetical protein